MLKADRIIFLVGAGASYDANIPISSQMIEKLENSIRNDKQWQKYRDLYFCIKSAIINAAGILGNFSPNLVNIETLVNTMDELIKSYEHPLYPFIGSWIPRLNDVCGNTFKNIKELRHDIINKLYNSWMKYEQEEDAAYYKKFLDLQKEYNFPLHIFTLNYDLCMENIVGKDFIQRGFSDNHIWNWKILDAKQYDEKPIWLYKLHGSIDWEKLDIGSVKETTGHISLEKLAIIFGTAYKLQYLDPFLYLVNIFREKTLSSETRGIICIGYSFNDEHINGIMSQSLAENKLQKIISISPCNEEEKKKEISTKLKLNDMDRIITINKSAKNWLESISCSVIEKYIVKEEDPF